MSDVKRVIVFGATGQCGLKILKRALDEGLEVTAYVRTPSKIPENIRNKLHKVIQGDVNDKEAVKNAVYGQDVVLSALGEKLSLGATQMIMSKGITNIIAGMKEHKMRNIIVVSGGLQLPSYAVVNYFMSLLVGEIADHKQMTKLLEEASDDIDWIEMAPPSITNSDKVNPDYVVAINKTAGTHSVTAAEIADFMIKITTDNDEMKIYKHTKVGISSQPSSGYTTPIAMSLLALAVGAVLYYIR